MRRVGLLLVVAAAAVWAAAGPAAPPPQCADGRDNDRDGYVDARFDPGCRGPTDADESAPPFACEIAKRIVGTRVTVSGACNGPFMRVEIEPRGGVSIADRENVDVAHARTCTTTARRILCAMRDGLANPKHLVRASFSTTSSATRQEIAVRVFSVPGGAGATAAARGADLALTLTGPKILHLDSDAAYWIQASIRNVGRAAHHGSGRLEVDVSRATPTIDGARFLKPCAGGPRNWQCPLVKLAPGGVDNLGSEFHRPTEAGEIVARARLRGTGDPRRSNDAAIFRTRVLPAAADLSVEVNAPLSTRIQQHNDDSKPYGFLAFDVVARNDGPSRSGRNVRVVLTFSKPLEISSSRTTLPGPFPCTLGAQEWVCTFNDVGPRKVALAVTVSTRIREAGTLSVSADVRGPYADPKGENNVSTDSSDVQPPR